MKDFIPNDGSRPSLLDLGRRVTGETAGDVVPAYAAAVERARAEVRPFHWGALVARSRAQPDETASWSARIRAWWQIPMLASAVALAFVAVKPPPSVRTKGGADLSFHVWDGGDGRPGTDGETLRAGDRIQLSYDAAGAASLVLVGIDGTGAMTVHFPSEGDAPLPIESGSGRALPDSLVLDAAPGPEAFVAVFGADSVAAATALVREAWMDRGTDGLRRLSDERADVDLVLIRKE